MNTKLCVYTILCCCQQKQFRLVENVLVPGIRIEMEWDKKKAAAASQTNFANTLYPSSSVHSSNCNLIKRYILNSRFFPTCIRSSRSVFHKLIYEHFDRMNKQRDNTAAVCITILFVFIAMLAALRFPEPTSLEIQTKFLKRASFTLTVIYQTIAISLASSLLNGLSTMLLLLLLLNR